MGGLCIEWDSCERCRGYIADGIHPDCIFSRYDNNRKGTEIMHVSLILSEDDILNIGTKVVFTMKKDDKEYIGTCFQKLDAHARNKIGEIIEEVTGPYGI
jgi:hypothetical protein